MTSWAPCPATIYTASGNAVFDQKVTTGTILNHKVSFAPAEVNTLGSFSVTVTALYLGGNTHSKVFTLNSICGPTSGDAVSKILANVVPEIPYMEKQWYLSG